MRNLKTEWIVQSIYSLLTLLMLAAAGPGALATSYRSEKKLPVVGTTFDVGGRTAFVIPANVQSSFQNKPWVWYAPTLPGLPGKEEQWMFEQLIAAGISIGGVDVGESYGSPAGRKLFSAFHAEMITHGYSAKPVLLGRSRGGLMALSWAAENPDKVGGFAGIYPVCNVKSYPGLEKAAPAYEMSVEELRDHLQEHNPVDRLASLALARVPLFAIHGDVDTVVPLEENSGLVRDRYAALGQAMELIVPPGQGHNMWLGFFQSQALVDFVKKHAGPNLTITSPLELSVIQRNSRNKGSVQIGGQLAGFQNAHYTIEGRLLNNEISSKLTKWRPLRVSDGTYRTRWTVPAGGWYFLEVRARSGTNILTETVVKRFGVGEIFVIAGQSNSANHGEEKYGTSTGLVSAFDGSRWQLAKDPQPGASGSGGSFIPPFADAVAQHFKVPVGIVACGVGATSVREWLPQGATFPNPPTITNNVALLPDGQWQSNGKIFDRFTTRQRQLGPRGFRAVLWHQGESDANQVDPTRTLPGALYRQYLQQLIRDSRREIGWPAPWFVAQASYHTPDDQGSPDIRAAQASLWKDGIALEGPDTDALKGDFRDNGGQGVHFSAIGLREHAARWFEKVTPWLEKKSPR